MRMWILNHYAAPPHRATGTRHYNLGRWFVEHGHDVTIFASTFNHCTRTHEAMAGESDQTRVTDVDGVRFVWIRTPGYLRNDVRRAWNMVAYTLRVPIAQARFPRPDVVVGSSVHLGAACAAWLIAVLRRVPFVFEVRDLWPQTLIDMGALAPTGLPARVLRAAESFLYRRARLIVSLLPGAVDYIAERGIPRDKVLYVPNGTAHTSPAAKAQPEPAAVTRDALARVAELRARGHVIAGYAGAHGAANRVDVLVRAAGALRDRGHGEVSVVLVGDGPEKAACVELAEREGLDNVLFLPPIPHADVPALLALFDITLFPLRDVPVFRYGLSSNKLFEYLASGRPTVFAAGVRDNPIRAAGSGICVPPETPTEIADAITSIMELSEAEREALGERGRRYVGTHHSFDVLGSRLMKALESI